MATVDKNSYFEKRKINSIERTEQIIDDLPSFCAEFFIGIENNTSPLTRLNYATDLRIFFDFIVKKVFKTKKVRVITLSDLEEITASDLEMYLSY